MAWGPEKNGSLGLSHPGIKSYLQILKSATCKCNRLETFTSKFGFRNYEPLLITGFPVNPRCRIMPWHWLQAGSHFHHNQRYHWCFPQHMQDHICEGWDRMCFFEKSTKLPSIWANYHAGWWLNQPLLKNILVKLDHETPGFGVKIKIFELPPPSMIPTPPQKLTAGNKNNGGGWKMLFLYKKNVDCQTSMSVFRCVSPELRKPVGGFPDPQPPFFGG